MLLKTIKINCGYVESEREEGDREGDKGTVVLRRGGKSMQKKKPNKWKWGVKEIDRNTISSTMLIKFY